MLEKVPLPFFSFIPTFYFLSLNILIKVHFLTNSVILQYNYLLRKLKVKNEINWSQTTISETKEEYPTKEGAPRYTWCIKYALKGEISGKGNPKNFHPLLGAKPINKV